VDIAMDRLHVAKKEQLLAERQRRNKIWVDKIQMLNLIALNHILSQSTKGLILMLQLTYPPHFLPNAAQKAIC